MAQAFSWGRASSSGGLGGWSGGVSPQAFLLSGISLCFETDGRAELLEAEA